MKEKKQDKRISEVSSSGAPKKSSTGRMWKSYDQLENKESFRRDYLHREFPIGASELPVETGGANEADKASLTKSANLKAASSHKNSSSKDDSSSSGKLGRRDFFKAMGAGLAVAGLSGCQAIRKPVSKIYPHVSRPEDLVPGESLFYATAFSQGDDVVGLLAKTTDSRPIKIEGNPLHPLNRGATNHFHQASILDLYDPDRIRNIVAGKNEVGHQGLGDWMAQLKKRLAEAGGQKVGLVFSHQPSPTFYRLLSELKAKHPNLSTYRFDALSNDNVLRGIKAISGKEAFAVPDYEKADVIVSLGSDFLSLGYNALASARSFANRRDPENSKFNRLYVYENSFTVTGGSSDHRYRIKRSDLELLIYAIVAEFYTQGVRLVDRNVISLVERYQQQINRAFRGTVIRSALGLVVRDLFSNMGKAVLVAGADLPPIVHSLIFYLNDLLRAPVSYYAPPVGAEYAGKSKLEVVEGLSKDLQSGKISDLIVLDCDLAEHAPSDLNIASSLEKVNLLTLSSHENATTALSKVVVPRSHYLEQWGDLISLQGDLSVVQPVLRPLSLESFSAIGLMQALVSDQVVKSPDAQKTELAAVKKTLSFSHARFRKVLHNGVVEDYVKNRLTLDSVQIATLVRSSEDINRNDDDLEVVFESDYSVYDGRYVNNAWLQELPDPITKLTWDNAVIMSKKRADLIGVKNQDVVELSVSGAATTVRGSVWILPGQADDSVSLKIGYGRKFGKIATGSGFSVSPLRLLNAYDVAAGLEIKKTADRYLLASVQDHWTIDDEIFEGKPSSNSQNDRPIYRKTTYTDYVGGGENFAKEAVEIPSLPKNHDKRKKAEAENRELAPGEEMSIFNEQSFSGEHQWGMTIDLSRCTGCNACVVACQAENNIPVVGKEMVLQGREMHWIRLDRYFDGDPHDPDMVHQPVNCMQCEQAPCEQVCPVAATVHSQEGLNDMVYNRCIGTRFCSNNCPYKVRRFNFFDYHADSPHSQKRISSHIFDLFKEPVESLQMQFNPDVSVRMRGVMEKCTYCIQRINKARIPARNQRRKIQDGEVKTACQQVCPSGAIAFGDLLDKASAVAKKKKLPREYGLLAELNLQTRTTYLGALTNPNETIERG